MDPEAKRPRSVALLVGLVLLLTVAGMFAALAPIGHCRSCEIEIAVRTAESEDSLRRPVDPHVCSHCNGKGRVTLLNMWLKTCGYGRVQ
jgi:hypothetical protein